MLTKRREIAESVRETVKDAGSALIAIAVIAVSALALAIGALFMTLRKPGIA